MAQFQTEHTLKAMPPIASKARRMNHLFTFGLLLAASLMADGADWIRPGSSTNQPVWGLRGGLLWAVVPGGFRTGEPQGLIRLGYPVLADKRYDLINDNIGRVPREAMAQMEKLARLAGARLLLREVAHEREVRRGALLHLETKWANVGVGKLYRQYALRYSLVDSAGQPGFVADAKADVRQWLPGDHAVSESLEIPATLASGDYDLAVGLVDPAGARRPFLLAIDAPERDGRYTVSQIGIR